MIDPAPFPGALTAEPMVMGVHGTLRLHPWIRQADDDGTLAEDVFSLVVKRTSAYGWSSFQAHGPEAVRWGHNDAGGDWTQDGNVRELAWLQVDVSAGARHGHRLPIVPVATVLGDALHRVGRVEVTGLHTQIPMHLAGDSRADLAAARDWFALADPNATVPLTVSVSIDDVTGSAGRIAAAAAERAYPAMTVDVLAGGFRCRAREWSLDVAAWVIEVFVDALRETGVTSRVSVRVEASTPDPGGS